MKAFLLAAGNGTRLRPLTDRVPKCLLPIQGTPLLGIWLELCKLHGIDEVLINVHAHANAVKEYLRDNNHGVETTVFEEPVLLGSAGTLAANRQWVSKGESFWVLYADVLTNLNLTELAYFHASHGQAATIALYAVDEPSRCGIVTLDQAGIVTEFVEKPQNPKGNLAFTGIMLATAELLDLLPESFPADIGTHVLPKLVGRTSGIETKEFVLDIGTLPNYERAQARWPGISAAVVR
jgi:mannose-1-phosphate guanylyltransferase